MNKSKRDVRRLELANQRGAQAKAVEALCDEALYALSHVRPEDRGKFMVWAIACLDDWEKGVKALTPAAMETVRRRLGRASKAWAKQG